LAVAYFLGHPVVTCPDKFIRDNVVVPSI